jgi:hypothetical protein
VIVESCDPDRIADELKGLFSFNFVDLERRRG